MSNYTYEGSGNEPPKYDSVVYQPTVKGASLSSILQAAVQNRLTNLLLEQIHPLVHSQASSGIYKAGFVLVPSDCFPPDENDNDDLSYDYGGKGAKYSEPVPKDELQSLSLTPMDGLRFVKMVWLQGQENNAQFLTQDRVIELLRLQLVADLCPERAQWEKDEAERERSRAASPPAQPPPPAVQKKSGGLFSRKRATPQQVPISSSMQADKITEVRVPPPSNGIEVVVTKEEICVRRCTPMGLYETRSGEGIVVHVNFDL